jgi:hypothetical protein
MNTRLRLARFMFALDALLGVLAVGDACLCGAAHARHADLWPIFISVFVPLSLLWSLSCYLAYHGLTGRNAVLAFIFWIHVVLNVFAFPIGTAIAGTSVWLWRESRKQDAGPRAVVTP